ncbi:MAG: tetratricopeptide repeat protein [Elusimicrobiota bacterium]
MTGKAGILPAESEMERGLRLIELEPEESNDPRRPALRPALFGFSARLRRLLSAGRWSERARSLRAARRFEALGPLLLRLGLPDAASSALAETGDSRCGEARGEALAGSGRFEAAAAEFEGALSRRPRSFWPRLWLYECRLRSGDRKDALRHWEAARELRPSSPWPSLARGKRGDLGDLRRAASLAPGAGPARLLLGWALLDSGRPRAAAVELAAGLRRAPGARWALILAARASLVCGDAPAARAAFEAALVTEPSLSPAPRARRLGEPASPDLRSLDAALRGGGEAWLYAWRGQLHFDQLRPEEALADLRRAAALDPSCGWSRALLARAQSLWLGRGDGIEELTRAAADSPKMAWIALWRGMLRERTGDRLGAGRDFERSARAAPAYGLARGWRGWHRVENGDPVGGLSDLDAAAELDPSYGLFFEKRRRALWRRGRAEDAYADMECAVRRECRFGWAEGPGEDALRRARAELSRRLKAHPDDGKARAWRGESRLRSGDPAGALEDLGESGESRGGIPWARAWRGEALLALGRPGPALDEIDASLAREPHDARARGARARALIARGRYPEALRDLDRVIEADFGAAWAYLERGRLRLRRGLRRGAEDDLRRALVLDRRMNEARSLLAEAGAVRHAGGR